MQKTKTGLLATTVLLAAGSLAAAEIYVPEGNANSALVLNDDLTEAGRITGLEEVHGLAAAPSRGLLLAGSLAVTAPGSVKRPEAISEDDHEAHHGGGAQVPAGDVSIVSAVDAKSGEIVRRIEVPGSVHHVAVDSDDRWAVVTHPGLAAISIIDLEDMSVAGTVNTGPGPEYSVFDPKTGQFYVSNAGNRTISVVDPRRGVVIRNIVLDNGPEHLAFDTGSGLIFAAEAESGTVSVIDAATGETRQRYDVGGELHGIAAQGNNIYVSARERGKIVRIDRKSGETEEADFGPQPYHMAIVRNGLLVSSAEEPLIRLIDIDDLSIRSTIRTQGIGHQMVVSQTEKTSQ